MRVKTAQSDSLLRSGAEQTCGAGTWNGGLGDRQTARNDTGRKPTRKDRVGDRSDTKMGCQEMLDVLDVEMEWKVEMEWNQNRTHL